MCRASCPKPTPFAWVADGRHPQRLPRQHDQLGASNGVTSKVLTNLIDPMQGRHGTDHGAPRCPKRGTLPSTVTNAPKASSASVMAGAGSPGTSRAPRMIRGSGAGPLSPISASPRLADLLLLKESAADVVEQAELVGPSASSRSKCQSFGCDPIAPRLFGQSCSHAFMAKSGQLTPSKRKSSLRFLKTASRRSGPDRSCSPGSS